MTSIPFWWISSISGNATCWSIFFEEPFDNYSLFYCVSVVVKEELDLVQQHPDLCNRTVPILFYGNKSDIEDSLSNVKIAAGTLQMNCLFILQAPENKKIFCEFVRDLNKIYIGSRSRLISTIKTICFLLFFSDIFRLLYGNRLQRFILHVSSYGRAVPYCMKQTNCFYFYYIIKWT